jgi:predicted RNA-binding protein with PUA domain
MKKATQMSCSLLGGSNNASLRSTNPLVNTPAENEQMEIVPVVIVTKCGACKKFISKEIVFLTKAENETYYHSFVENSIPGVVKYVNCAKCDKKCESADLKLVR